jgi:hypothetical protein
MNMYQQYRYRLIVAMCFVATGFGGCEDLLPVYTEPGDIFTLAILYHDSSLCTFYDTDKSDTLTLYRLTNMGHYAMLVLNPMLNAHYYWQSNPYYFHSQFYLKNIYEETIQSKSDVQGWLEIWPKAAPSVKRSIPFDNRIFLGSPLYSPVTETFTVKPGERIYFYASWDFKLGNGQYIHHYAQPPRSVTIDSTYYVRITYPPLPMTMRLSIRVLETSKMYIVERDFFLQLECLYFSPPND